MDRFQELNKWHAWNYLEKGKQCKSIDSRTSKRPAGEWFKSMVMPLLRWGDYIFGICSMKFNKLHQVTKRQYHLMMEWQKTHDQQSTHWMWNYIYFSTPRSLVSSFQFHFKIFNQLFNSANTIVMVVRLVEARTIVDIVIVKYRK